MKNVLLLPLVLVLAITAGCIEEAGSECAGGACAEKECSGEKCTRKLPVEVTREEQYTAYKDVEKDCEVISKVPVTNKVPVKTFKYVQRWVDTQVQEPYYVTEKRRVKTKVAVEEQYMGYDMVEKEYTETIDCPKTIVTKSCECQTVNGKRTIIECDKCGNSKQITVNSQWQKPVQKVDSTVEVAKCPVTRTKMVKVPVMKTRTVMRDGYKTVEVKVKKMRTVPGKKLVRTRVCETVMKDEVTYKDQKRTVKRTVKVPEVKTRTITETKMQLVPVNCRTGERIVPKAENGNGQAQKNGAKEEVSQAPKAANNG